MNICPISSELRVIDLTVQANLKEKDRNKMRLTDAGPTSQYRASRVFIYYIISLGPAKADQLP